MKAGVVVYRTKVEEVTESMWERYTQTHDVNLRNRILMAYIHVVTYNVRKMSAVYHNHADTQDIVNQGVLALMDCIDKYDYTRGVQFDSFASIRVRGSIIDYIRKQDWIPRGVRKKSNSISNAYAELQEQFGRPATDAEVAEYIGMNIEELNKTVSEVYSASIYSFEELIQDSSVAVQDSGIRTPEQEVQKSELKSTLASAIDMLDEKERTVVSLYYFEELKLKEIAVVMGLTASRVSQLHSKAMLKLRSMLSDYIRD